MNKMNFVTSIKYFTLFFLCHVIIFSKTTVHTDTVFFYPTSISIDEAKIESLNRCRKIAIEKVVPKKTIIAGNAILEKMERDGEYHENAAFTSFHNSTSIGYIVDEKVLKSSPVTFTDNGYNYRISYRAEVEIPTGDRDPSLRLEFWSVSKSLNDGDALVLNVKSTTDGYIYILHFMQDQSVEMMFPNQYLPDNKLVKNIIYKFPKDRRIKIRLTALQDRPITVETFYAVFCKTKIPAMTNIMQINETEGRVSSGHESFQQLQMVLAKIPLSYRTEAACQVLVVPMDK